MKGQSVKPLTDRIVLVPRGFPWSYFLHIRSHTCWLVWKPNTKKGVHTNKRRIESSFRRFGVLQKSPKRTNDKMKVHPVVCSFRRLKPQSDIHCNRSATSPRLTIFTDRRGRNKVPDRSRRGCREVGDWSGTSLRPNQSQPGFCACTKTWLRLIWSQTGPGEVADQSPISRRLVADRSPTNFVRIGAWLSLQLVGDWSATNRGPLRDLTATSWRPVRNFF